MNFFNPECELKNQSYLIERKNATVFLLKENQILLHRPH